LAVKQQIVDMTLNGSGVRDIARVLHVSTRPVVAELKKVDVLSAVNEPILEQIDLQQVNVDIVAVKLVADPSALEAELDEMWSFVQKKQNQRWLWHAIEHETGKVLAYVLGNRTDKVFLKLKALLEPFGISKFYTDGWGAYEWKLDLNQHQIGKANTQKIERKHLTLRTRIKRLARRTICFSKSETIHDVVIGLFIIRLRRSGALRYEFGLSV